MRRSAAHTVLVLIVLSSAAWAAEPPVAVSPGDASRLALTGDTCPAFSWGAVSGAEGYELVVYRLTEEGEEAPPVLRQTFTGTASSWTPSLDRCLERGGRYAWSVRSVGGKEASEWSALSLFEVASGASEAEFDQALALVRQYFVTEGGAEPEGVAEAEPQSRREASSSSFGAPAAGVVGTTQLSVDGGVVATSFTGDGSALTSLNADPPCFNTTHRFVDCANGTVTDTVSGLIYLKNANCFGFQNWPTANQSAAGLADGACGLTDGSRAGDWRLQTKEEWEAILASGCAVAPKIIGNGSNSSTSCYSDSPWASGVVSSRYWSSTTGAANSTSAWDGNLVFGVVGFGNKTFNDYVWPVRGGQ